VAELLVIALLGGVITGFSPCIIPVLPAIVAGGSSSGTSRARPYLIVGGLVLSFSLQVLLGNTIVSALGLPSAFLIWLGVGLLGLLGVSLLIPVVGHWIERPFARLGAGRYAQRGGGFVLGLSLGLVFVPCAGPVEGAIATAAGTHHITVSGLFVTLFYAAGTAVSLLILSLLAQRAALWQKMRTRLPTIRVVSGAVLALTALTVALSTAYPGSALDWLAPLQRGASGYASTIEDHLEGGGSVAKQLQAISGEHANKFANAAAKAKSKAATSNTSTTSSAKTANMVTLPKLGMAPNFTGIVSWFNTPDDRALSLAQLRGKVVLVDFWTYSCINCQRSLPHVEAWYNAYRKDGLVVVGVSTPEFAFEHVVSNVHSAADNLGIDYPVAIDNNYATWTAYGNQYWPAEYLIDPNGEVRAYDAGEGGYGTMEANIRSLLAANGATNLPTATDVPNKTPTEDTTLESYVGYQESQYQVGSPLVPNKATVYQSPADVPINFYSLNGTWTVHAQEATAGANASLDLHFLANDVYLVLSGTGTVTVSFNGRPIKTVNVSGVPGLYTLFSGASLQSGQLNLTFSPGVEAYDFTFG
jgi:cytochrome c biogenesis protein CcdA/thiol-disulfide isomerase/thioredoxin